VAVDVGDEGEGQPLHRSAGGHGQLREAVAAAPHLWSRVVKLGLDLEDAGVGVVDDGRASGGLQEDEQHRQPKSWWLWFATGAHVRGVWAWRWRRAGEARGVAMPVGGEVDSCQPWPGRATGGG
jgi:hypothetical protein